MSFCAPPPTCPRRDFPVPRCLRSSPGWPGAGAIATAEKAALRTWSPMIRAISPVWSGWPTLPPRMATEAGGRMAAPQGRRRSRARTLPGSHESSPTFLARAATLHAAAEAIGRRFDAQAWWRLAARHDPSLDAAGRPPHEPTGSNDQTGVRPRDACRLARTARPGDRARRDPGSRTPHAIFSDDAQRWGLNFAFDNGASDRSASFPKR